VEPNYGCAADNYDIVLDDEGTGGTIESQCFDYLSSPPNYTPNELLSAFDGMDAAGDWVIEVSDNAGDDVGTLDAWSIHLTEQGNPCAVGACCFGEVCIDGQPQDTCETTGVWMGPDTTCDCNPCIGIDQADPPSGTVDARQPHPVDSALPRQGIGSVDEPMTITLGEVGLEACFDLCETVVDPLLGVNAIGTVVDLGGGVYEIVLDHAITAGAVTTIQYNGDGSFVEYISHPANADADAGSAPADILVIIDVLNEVRTPVHGHYSQDIDHDGDYGPADILRLIDLLNGAGAYDSWLDVLLPQNTSCP
jgi:hypothetical protein